MLLLQSCAFSVLIKNDKQMFPSEGLSRTSLEVSVTYDA